VWSCAKDGTVREWCCATGECVSQLRPADSGEGVAVNAIALDDGLFFESIKNDFIKYNITF
jgi:hypothetical protein